jgi:hypothetical protein
VALVAAVQQQQQQQFCLNAKISMLFFDFYRRWNVDRHVVDLRRAHQLRVGAACCLYKSGVNEAERDTFTTNLQSISKDLHCSTGKLLLMLHRHLRPLPLITSNTWLTRATHTRRHSLCKSSKLLSYSQNTPTKTKTIIHTDIKSPRSIVLGMLKINLPTPAPPPASSFFSHKH